MPDDIEQLRRDAERYRWLRSQHWTNGNLAVIRTSSLQLGTQTYTAERLDAQIDVAIGSASQPGADRG